MAVAVGISRRTRAEIDGELRVDSESIVVRVDEDLIELIPPYLSNRRKDIEAVSRALGDEDYESISTLGHTMKGSGGGCGFDRISDIGSGLEEAAMGQDAARVRRWLDKLQDYLNRVQVIAEQAHE